MCVKELAQLLPSQKSQVCQIAESHVDSFGKLEDQTSQPKNQS